MIANDSTFNTDIFDKIMKNIVQNYKIKIDETERYPEIIYPEIEEFKKFLNKYDINNLKTYEIKIQIYIIILFYIYFAYSSILTFI